MKQAWQVTVWGVRGSAPRPQPDFMEYGGNTVCISLERGGQVTVLDAGTGLATLGQALSGRTDVTRIDILLSHLHIDHVLGLYSFAPLFRPDLELHLYGGAGLKQYLTALVAPPFWPLKLEEFPARPVFHELRPGDAFDLAGLSVSTLAGNHPGGSLLYRLAGEGKCLTYALDCETDEQTFSALADFARGSDLLIWDANFTPSDLRPGWGHSTWEQGLALGRAAGVGRVLMTHYNQEYTDGFLRGQEEHALSGGACLFAKEGLAVAL